MDNSLFAILGFCFVYAGLLYYYIFIRKEQRLGLWGKPGIVSLLFLIPVVPIMALWFQSGAESRLEKLGFKAYPGFISSSGIATGTGEAPIWVFNIAGNERSALEFYKNAENYGGWSLVSENDSGLTFRRDGEKLSVSIYAGNVIFTLNANPQQNLKNAYE